MPESRISFNLPFRVQEQYASPPQLTLRGETKEELDELLVAFDLVDLFDTLKAEKLLAVGFQAEPERSTAPAASVAASAPSAAAAPVSADTYYCPQHPNAGPMTPVNRADKKSAYYVCPLGYSKCKDDGGKGAAVDAEGKGVSLPYNAAYNRTYRK